MASTAVRTWGTAVIRMTAMDSESPRIRGSTTGPDSPGMRTSSNATSTRRDRMMSSPAAPSAASMTAKSSVRMKRSESRTPGASSMTRTTGRSGYVTTGGGALASAGSALSLEVGYRENDIFVAPSAALDIDGNDLGLTVEPLTPDATSVTTTPALAVSLNRWLASGVRGSTVSP